MRHFAVLNRQYTMKSEVAAAGRGDGSGLCGHWRRVGRLRRRQPAERGRLAGRAARGRTARSRPDDPHPGGRSARPQQPQDQLEFLQRGRTGVRRSTAAMAARQDSRRHQLDQRHAVCARQPGRLRQLGADGLSRLELRRGAAVLSQVGDLSRQRRSGIPQPRRPADRRGLPHGPRSDPQLCRGRQAGRFPVHRGLQRQTPRRVLPIRR